MKVCIYNFCMKKKQQQIFEKQKENLSLVVYSFSQSPHEENFMCFCLNLINAQLCY